MKNYDVIYNKVLLSIPKVLLFMHSTKYVAFGTLSLLQRGPCTFLIWEISNEPNSIRLLNPNVFEPIEYETTNLKTFTREKYIRECLSQENYSSSTWNEQYAVYSYICYGLLIILPYEGHSFKFDNEPTIPGTWWDTRPIVNRNAISVCYGKNKKIVDYFFFDETDGFRKIRNYLTDLREEKLNLKIESYRFVDTQLLTLNYYSNGLARTKFRYARENKEKGYITHISKVLVHPNYPSTRNLSKNPIQSVDTADSFSIININSETKINENKWKKYFANDGSLISIKQLAKDIYRYGIDVGLKAEAYKYLLGIYKPNMNNDAKILFDIEQRALFRNLDFPQIFGSKSIKMKKYESLINIKKQILELNKYIFQNLINIEMVVEIESLLNFHAKYDFELGCMSGMCNVLFPLLQTLDNTEDIFWCFAYDVKLRRNLHNLNKNYVLQLIEEINAILKYVCPIYFLFLKSIGMGDGSIYVNWLVIRFLNFNNLLEYIRFNEILWSQNHAKGYESFLCVAIIMLKIEKLTQNETISQEKLKSYFEHLNDIDYQSLILKTNQIIKQLKKEKYQPKYLIKLLKKPFPAIKY